MKRQQLQIKDIVEKEFKKSFKGANLNEIDDFLNTIIEDYEYFEEVITSLKKDLELLRNENYKIKMNVLNQSIHTLDFDEEKKTKQEVKKESKEDVSDLYDKISKIEQIIEKNGIK